jgi:hypothetical protein
VSLRLSPTLLGSKPTSSTTSTPPGLVEGGAVTLAGASKPQLLAVLPVLADLKLHL